MFDIGATELLVIAIVAIVVVGPRELPRMLRTVGQFVSKAKGMAREFQTQFEEAAEDTGVNEIRQDLEKMTDLSEDFDFDFDPNDALDPSKPEKSKAKRTAKPKKAKPKKAKPNKTKSTKKSAAKGKASRGKAS